MFFFHTLYEKLLDDESLDKEGLISIPDNEYYWSRAGQLN